MFGHKAKSVSDVNSSNPEALPATITPEDPGTTAHILSKVMETGARLQEPAIHAYVKRLKESSPDATPDEIVRRLQKHYLAAVTGSGAAVGASALVPGVGTLLALTLVAGETALFLETTAVFILAVAEVHGISVKDKERRQTLVLATLAGDEGREAISQLLGPGRTNGAWIGDSAAKLPLPAVGQLNTRLFKFFAKKFAIKRGALIFGKVLPVGIGAFIGAIGNRIMGKRIVKNADAAFGPAPAKWPNPLQVLPAVVDGTDH